MSQCKRKEQNLEGSTCSSLCDIPAESSAYKKLEEQVTALKVENSELREKVQRLRSKNERLRVNRKQLLQNIELEHRNQDLLRDELQKLSAEIINFQQQMTNLNATVQTLQHILHHKHSQTLSLSRQLERVTTKSSIAARKFADQITTIKTESVKQLDELRQSYRLLKHMFHKVSKRNPRQQLDFTLSDDDDTAASTLKTTT